MRRRCENLEDEEEQERRERKNKEQEENIEIRRASAVKMNTTSMQRRNSFFL
jgi:hypothetical protein